MNLCFVSLYLSLYGERHLTLLVLEYVLQGSGLYASIPTTLCTLKPQITRVDVQYTQFSTDASGHLDRIEVLDPSEVMDMPLPPSAQRSLVDDLLRASQLVERNHLGDSVRSFVDNVDGRRELNEILVRVRCGFFLLNSPR
jgi:hypothetical protein